MKAILKYLYIIVCLHIYIYSNSQNLVPNPSFEIHSDCIYGLIENASPWCGVNPVGFNHACHIDNTHTVPTQYFSPGYPSFQVPRTGDAYAEIGFAMPTMTAVSRYPHIKLVDTLETGKIYCVTYYVSLWNDCKYSADKMGALLTATPFDCTQSNQNLYTGYTPQVVSPAGYLYNDTLNWQEVSGSFTAVGNEAYLTIGNFFPNASHTFSLSYPSGVRFLADYYLDDVSVEEVEIAKAKNDTLIMQGDSAVIGLNNSEAALFNWQPTAGLSCTNCPNPKASPTITTTYTVTKTQCKSVTSDVITVTVNPTGINELTINNIITLLPNPTNGYVTINSKLGMQQVEIINLAGQILLQENVNDKTHQLQLQSFAEGIYFVRVRYFDGLCAIKKIVRQ